MKAVNMRTGDIEDVTLRRGEKFERNVVIYHQHGIERVKDTYVVIEDNPSEAKKQDKFSRIVEIAPEMYKTLEKIRDIEPNEFITERGALELAKDLAWLMLEKCKNDYPDIEE